MTNATLGRSGFHLDRAQVIVHLLVLSQEAGFRYLRIVF